MLRKIYFSAIVFFLFGAVAFAQNNSGSIKVLLKDKANGEAIPFANVVAYQNGVQVGVATTDIDGYAIIKPLTPGKYDIKGVYVGYQPKEVKGVIVGEGRTAYPTIELENGEGVKLDEVVVVEYQVPLIDPDTKSGNTVTRETYQNMATKNINSVAATTAGVFQADEGAALNVRGGRSDNTTYFVDGVKIIGGQGIPQQSVEQINVITGGLPAQYGDATSGVISVTTRGPQSNFFGGIELISSQLTDAYGYNSIGFSTGGPIWQRKDTAGNKTPVIGFFISGQGTYQKDPNPSYVPIYKVNDDVLKSIQDHPLTLSPSGTGFVRRLDYMTKSDMQTIKARQNVAQRAIQLNGKLDFKLAPNTNLTLGGALDYSNYHDYVYEYSLFNAENNPQVINTTWRTFARINQKFGVQGSAKEKSQSVVSNAYFTFLASYEQTKQKVQDDSHKDNLFNYGYIGKFRQNLDTSNFDLKVVNNGAQENYYYTGAGINSISFDRSNLNSTASAYTQQIFDYFGQMKTLTDVQTNNGFINGDRPQNINSLFSSTGRQYNGNSKTNNTQLRFSSSFSADIKNHAIMVGVEYDQRDQRGYSITPIDLWTRMRQLAYQSTFSDTTYIGQMNGQYGTHDAYMIRYDNAHSSSQFIRNMVKELGAAGQSASYINVDQYSPDQFKLNMFSASDLLNNGVSPLVDYYGYDYLGNRYNAATNLNDFLNKKDANGNNLYPVGSFRPIYVAGYIQDKFDFKDMKFNVGLRVDRFDANQKVPKDQYVFQDVYTAGEKVGNHPSTIGDNYVVYVKENLTSNNTANPTVIGYRNGKTWYNSEGQQVSDPTLLASGATPYPYFKDPNAAKSAFSTSAFTDYKAQINFMPRVAFSFPISDVANFFAHYDVLTQRPTGDASFDMRFDPKDYLFLGSTSSTPFITNPGLKPAKTVDYELGYNQVLNEKKNAAIKMTAFYREMRNQITVVSLSQAYPKTYLTYANQDFGTVKGMSFEFDLRRTNGFQLTANYTLQFADGSGSNSSSGANLATSGQPNLRVTLPLDYDQRHNFTTVLDYRFGSGKDYRGPKWNKKKKDGSEQTVQFLKNVGANLTLHTGSGTPYTRWTNAVALGSRSNIDGTLNGSRKPWQFRTDLRIDKNVELTWGKKDGDSRKTANLNVYLQILNLLNTKNIMNVYNFTGNADDDGYLKSATGQQTVKNSLSPAGFIDQYGIYINNPGNYGRPRTIRIGVMLDF